MKIVVILWICSVYQTIIYFPIWDKSSESRANNPKLEDMYSTWVGKEQMDSSVDSQKGEKVENK